MHRLFAAIFVIIFPMILFAQEDLIEVGKEGLKKRSWVLLDTEMFVKGERPIEVPDTALKSRTYNYVAFYVDDALVGIDEVPPYSITHDFGNFTHKAKILAVGVRFEIDEKQAKVDAEDTATTEQVAKEENAGEVKREAVEQEQSKAVLSEAEKKREADPANQQEGTIAIVAPAPEEYAFGLKLLKAVVNLPLEQVMRVDFLVNDQPAGSVSAPPYEVEHDFGRGFEPQRVKAVAVLADGRQISAEIVTTPLEKSNYFVRTSLVTLEATVVDWRDRLVGDLKQNEFKVFDDGKEQKITNFAVEERPIRVALLIDCSSSMTYRGKMGKAASAAQHFLDYLKKGQDKAALIAFTDKVNLLSGFTDDFTKLNNMIGKLKPIGGTAINDALDQVAPLFEDETGRKAVVLITDGLDEHSTVSVDDAVEKVRRAGIKIYSIGIFEQNIMLQEAIAAPSTRQGKTPDVDPEDARKGNRPFKKGDDFRTVMFEGLSDETGGAAFFPKRLEELPMVFNRIADELRHMYSIGYIPKDAKRDGKWHKIKVETTRGGLTVRAKKGYYAEK